MRHKSLSFIAGFACLLSGCSHAPEHDAKTMEWTMPYRWHAASQNGGPVKDDWVSSFSDPGLTGLIDEVMSRNFDLKTAAARVDAARARARAEGAGRLPQVYFAPGYQRSEGLNTTGVNAFSSFDAFFGLNWELDIWGRIKASAAAASREMEATSADLQAARLSLAARAAQTYFSLTEARLQVDVAERSIAERRTIAELVRGRFNSGLTQGLDLRLALSDLANAEAQLAEARNIVQQSARFLEILLGRYPEGSIQAAAKLPRLPETIPQGLPSELLERRPDIIAAFKRLRAADSRLESAQKALLPRITLSANGGTSSPALTELIDPRAAAWNLAMGLAQPIFTGGRLQGDIALKEAQVKEAWNSYQQTALNAFKEVEQSLAADEWLRAKEAALAEAVKQAEGSQSMAVYAYRQGFIQILTLLDSYRSTRNARSAHLAVQRQLLSNRLDLYLALGGGYAAQGDHTKDLD